MAVTVTVSMIGGCIWNREKIKLTLRVASGVTSTHDGSCPSVSQKVEFTIDIPNLIPCWSCGAEDCNDISSGIFQLRK